MPAQHTIMTQDEAESTLSELADITTQHNTLALGYMLGHTLGALLALALLPGPDELVAQYAAAGRAREILRVSRNHLTLCRRC